MRLNPWHLIVPLAVAAALLVAAAFDASAPRATASCEKADVAMTHGLPTSAEKQYVAILADEPGSDCATDGMQRVVDELCARANVLAGVKTWAAWWPLRLLLHGPGDASPAARERAKTLYATVLAVEPSRVRTHCAVEGLASLPSDAPAPAAKASTTATSQERAQ